jgi:hypothetical protein
LLHACRDSQFSLTFAVSFVIATTIGCAGGTEPMLSIFSADSVHVSGHFRETASAALSPLRAAVDVGLQLTNQSAQPETLLSSGRGTCDGEMVIRVWRPLNGQLVLAWNSAALPPNPCPAHALPLVLAPHAATLLTHEIASTELLGDSLPADTYTFTVSADFASPEIPGEVATSPVAVSTHFIVPPGTVLDGTWAGAADGIVLTLRLHWTADSVTGTGTYQGFTPNSNHCGGGTLRGTGSVTLSAVRTADRVIGAMSFSNGWTPPYGATLTSAGQLDGQFMSVDAGPCQMPLALQIP